MLKVKAALLTMFSRLRWLAVRRKRVVKIIRLPTQR